MPCGRPHLSPTFVLGLVALTTLGVGCSGRQPPGGEGIRSPSLSSSPTSVPAAAASPSDSSTHSSPPPTRQPSSRATTPGQPKTEVVAHDLDVPWSTAFLPDGSALVTTRDKAAVLHVRSGQPARSLGVVDGVRPGGEGGLLGVAVSPSYARDHRIFLYFTAASDNRVVRLTFDGDRTGAAVPIVTGIHKAGNHNGGRLAFGPDGYLYVTTGDAGEGDIAQDRHSLNGKILRVTQDGRPAPGNPFGDSPVWTYGHRNVQGIAWAPDGRMYASEFGQNTWDELNLIEPGRDYGWPVVEGRAGRAGYVDPVAQWPTSQASPSGIAVFHGAIYLAALRGESLWRVPLTSKGIGTPQRLFHDRYGRLRDAVSGPDDRLWVLTSNTFRGDAGPQDDRLIAFAPPDVS